MLSAWKKLSGGYKGVTVCLAASLAVGAWVMPTEGAKPKGSDKKKGVTDAEVVESMKKGIEFLLSQKKGDNWESGKDWSHGQSGGETSIVVYALLHAHGSLADDPDFAAKIHQRHTNMASAIEYLSKLQPTETYVAGLQASALALVTKRPDEKPGEGALPGLNAAKDYILGAMGSTGGYDYGYGGSDKSLVQAWSVYFEAWGSNKDKKAIDEARKSIFDRAQGMANTFGGLEVAVAGVERGIRDRGAAAKVAGDKKALMIAEAEYKEFMRIKAELPRGGGAGTDFNRALMDARGRLADAERNQLKGAMKDVDKKDANGNTMKGADGKTIREKVPKTKEDLQKEVDQAKGELARAEFEAKNKFNPIGDLSNAQYGTLGAWALVDSPYRIELPMAYWSVQDRFWRLMQGPDGGWPYSANGGQSIQTMGVAGIASLFITQEFLDTELRLVAKPDKNIELGLAWLKKTFKPMGSNMYYMYGVERVGLSSGLKYFGTVDWYREGAADVIRNQAADGSWSGGFWQSEKSIATSYAILFLARGRNPILYNKLEYPGQQWNARGRDSANLSQWLSKNLERPINWQTVNLEVDPEDWLDAPVLLITGSQDPKFKPADVAKIRAYVEAGGMVFSTADGGGKGFSTAMEKLAAEIVENKYEIKKLDQKHALFTGELWQPVKNPPNMWVMSNGVRDMWIHSNEDLGASWQMRRTATEAHFVVPANIAFYAIGREKMRSKLQTLNILAAAEKAVRTIQVARVDHMGNADPEPGAWRRMVKLAQADFRTDLRVTKVTFAQLDPKIFKIAHMTGSTRFTVAAADIAALKAYLDGGGTLFVDSAGGSPEFTNSARAMLKDVYGKDSLSPLAPDHPIILGNFPDGGDVSEVKFRKFGNLKLGSGVRSPRLEGITVKDRMMVILSPHDISSGFMGTTTWGNVGYMPESAQDIARNILLYVNDPKAVAAPATGPATGPAAAPVVGEAAAPK